MAFDNPPESFPRTGRSACPHDCPSTCALEVELLGPDKIGAVRGAEEHPYTAGVICAKVARYAERIHHPDRLTQPMLRVGPKGSKQFTPISWTEALDRVAENFLSVAQKHGSEAIWPYYYAGTMGLVQRDGINRLRHAMRYSQMKKTFCTTLARAGWAAGVGEVMGPDAREMAQSDLIVSWGGNPVSTQVNVMTYVAQARKQRGAKFVVVDPYRTPTAQGADVHLLLRPGTDAALACAVMHVAFRDGYADRAYMAQYTDDPAGLEAHVRSRDPAWASAITGLTVQEIEDFAALYGRTERAYIRLGYGFSRSRNGAAQFHAVTCLPSVTGKWRHEGGGALWGHSDIYHLDRTLIEGLDVRDPSTRTLDMSRIGAVLTGDRSDLGDGPEVHAMLVQNTNPATVAPNSALVRRGLLREDLFFCVHEQFMTDTAAYADVILPATMFLEHDDIYTGGGHSFLQLGAKQVNAPGECRSNHFVITELARRLGAQHRGFTMTERELIDETLKTSGWPGFDALLEAKWLDAAPSFEKAHFLDGFPNASGKFRFKPDWSAIGAGHAQMPEFPDHATLIEQADAEHPFRLVAAPARSFLNSTFGETPSSRKREGRPTALIHPDDAAKLGVTTGAIVTLGNRRGQIQIHAKLFDGLQPGSIVVESIWPNSDFIGGLGVNALTSDDPGFPNGGAVFHDSAIWVKPSASVEEDEEAAGEKVLEAV